MIVERIASLFSRPRIQSLASQDGGSGGWRLIFDLLDGHRSSSGQTVTAASAIRLSAVYACVRVLSETIAQLPWHIYEKRRNGDRVVASQHLLNNLLRFPNFWQNSVEFREMAMVHLALRGNFFAEIVAGENGFATQLEPLHPDRMFRIERTDAGQLRYYYRTPQGDEQTFMQRQMFHIRALGMEGFFGLNPIEVARETFGNAMAADKFAGKFFSNNSRPSGILTSDANMTREAAERNKANWQAANAGEENWHKVAVLSNGLKWQPISISNKDSQFLETRQFSITDIARIFRVPPHMVGDLSRSSFSNIEQQGREFVDYTIMPWVRRWEEAFARDLILDPDRYYLKFELGGLLRGDSAARGAYYSTMINAGVLMPGEARELEDLNRVPGDDKLLIQGAMIPLEDVGKEPEPPPALPSPPEPEADDDGEETIEEQRRQIAELENQVAAQLLELRRKEHELGLLEGELDQLKREQIATKADLASMQDKLASQCELIGEQSEAVRRLESKREDLEARIREKSTELAAAHAELQGRDELQGRYQETLARAMELEIANRKALGRCGIASSIALDIIQENLERLQAIETKNAVDAAKKPEGFQEWLSSFYSEHQHRCIRTLTAPTKVYAELSDKEIDIAQEVSAQLGHSKSRLQSIYDTATPAEFLAQVTEEVNSWDCKSIIRSIKGEHDAAAD